MRQELRPDNIAEFWERFRSFHDAVIHHIKFDLFTKTIQVNPYVISIVVGTRETKEGQQLGTGTEFQWINLTFDIEDVTSFFLTRSIRYSYSIIFKLNIGFIEDGIYLDFFKGFDDIPKPTNHSNCYEGAKEALNRYEGPLLIVAGKRCYWSTGPYKDRGVDES